MCHADYADSADVFFFKIILPLTRRNASGCKVSDLFLNYNKKICFFLFFCNIRLELFSKSTFCETRKQLICFLLQPDAFLLVRWHENCRYFDIFIKPKGVLLCIMPLWEKVACDAAWRIVRISIIYGNGRRESVEQALPAIMYGHCR